MPPHSSRRTRDTTSTLEIADFDEVEGEPLPPDEIRKLTSDPIRMYLSQMSGIPLLTREQEIAYRQEDRGS